MERQFTKYKIREILDILPHRYPLLLVDRVLETDGTTRMVALKNVTVNEAYFAGHFPSNPVMPGVLVVEALAQVGVLFLFCKDEDRHNKVAYFSGIDHFRFRNPVVPGDQLRLEITVIKQRERYFRMKAEAWVEDTLVAEGELSCTIVNRAGKS